jgi:thioesterase domain-containing protein
MAQAYLDEVTALQPRGPYLLSGYCGGGLVAYEMAQQLLSSGESVELLALIDTFHPDVRIEYRSLGEKLKAARIHGPEYLLELGQAKLNRDFTRAVRHLRIRYFETTGQRLPHALREHWLIDNFIRSMRRYEVRPFPGRLVLFKARDVPDELTYSDRDLGWQGMADAGLACYEVPGDHHAMAEEPNVRIVADELNSRIRRVKMAG